MVLRSTKSVQVKSIHSFWIPKNGKFSLVASLDKDSLESVAVIKSLSLLNALKYSTTSESYRYQLVIVIHWW